MKNRPETHSFVQHKISGLKAQVYQHYIDRPDMVGVILLPQPGAHPNDIYKRWHIDDCNAVPNVELTGSALLRSPA